jgi:hypothetical protein
MQSVGYAALEVIPSMKGFEGKLTSQTNPILSRSGVVGGGKFGDSAGKSMSSRFVGHAKAAAILAGGVLGGVAAIGLKIGKDSIAEAREAQRVGAITTNVIKSTGHAANVSAGQVGKLATAISNRVGIDDEAIQSGANLILTFKQIQDQAGKGNKIFDQATKVTTDMAVAMAGGSGGEPDLKSSAILVGKALNDPAKGLSALTRVGVTFDAQQQKQIKSLTAQGDTMKAQKIILKELQSEFGGTARAQATMGDKVQVAWKNIEENIGTALLPLIDDLEHAFLKKGVPALQKFSDWFQKDGTKKIEDFVHKAEPLANSLLPAVGTGFKDIRDFLKEAAPYAKQTIDAFNSLPAWAQKAVVLGAAGGVIAKKTGLLSVGKNALTGGGSSSGGLLGLVSKSKPLPVFVVNEGFGPTGPKGAPTVLGGGKGLLGKLGVLGLGATAIGGINETLNPVFTKEFGPRLGGAVSDSIRAAFHLPDPELKGIGFKIAKGFLGGLTGDKPPSSPAVSPQDVQRGIDLRRADIPKIRSTSTSIDALNQGLRTTSRQLDLIGPKGDKTFKSFGDLQRSTGEYRALLNQLPKKVQTAIETPGMIQTQRDIQDLRRKYDLTPRQVRTLFRLEGIPQARREFDAFQAHMGRHSTFEQNIELAGRGPAQSNLDGTRRR